MGNVTLGVNHEKTIALAAQYGIRHFIETGTWKGGTCTWAAQHFERVITIEADRGRFEKTASHFAGVYPNLSFWYGDSRAILGRALAEMDAPCLIWADAHWVGGGAHQAHEIGDECPLEQELEAVNASKYAAQHVILIDDARLFTAPPPYPHDPSQWLTYAEIQALLGDERDVFIEDDVIYGLPRR